MENYRSHSNKDCTLSNKPFKKILKFDKPATYRIRVVGHIDDSLSDRLGGMIITRAFTADGRPLTILVGYLRDQAALSGTLNGLYELHLPLLTVESLPNSLEQAIPDNIPI